MQFVNVFSKILTLLIITPIISKNNEYFTIYTYGISLISFLNYADLGFFRASQKYASEYVTKNDKISIYKSIGFGTFITMIIILILSFIFILISINPLLAISKITSEHQIIFARKLFFLMAISTPLVLIQRMILSLYEINLASYRYYFLNILSSLLILLICFIQIKLKSFSILSYFLSIQIINLFLIIYLFFDLKIWFKYDTKKIIKSIKFSKSEFLKTKKLALTSLFSMITWFLFYEIDLVILAKFIPINELSYYSLSLVILSFFRTFTGILFGTFNIRINNLLGAKDDKGYVNYSKIFLYTSAPIVLYITFSYLTFSNYFINLWVGHNYYKSSMISNYLIIGYSLSFISYISSSLLISKNRLKETFYISLAQPILFWLFVFATYKKYGVISVAIVKCLILLFSDVLYFKYIIDFIKISFTDIFYKLLKPFIILIFPLYFLINYFITHFHNDSNKISIIYLGSYVTIILIFIVLIHYKISKLDLRFIGINLFSKNDS